MKPVAQSCDVRCLSLATERLYVTDARKRLEWTAGIVGDFLMKDPQTVERLFPLIIIKHNAGFKCNVKRRMNWELRE